MSERPFRVLGVQQLAIGAPSKAPLLALWHELLGVPRVVACGHFSTCEGEVGAP